MKVKVCLATNFNVSLKFCDSIIHLVAGDFVEFSVPESFGDIVTIGLIDYGRELSTFSKTGVCDE